MTPIGQNPPSFTPGIGNQGIKRPALPGGASGGGQAGSFQACYNNYMNTYRATCQ
jgi:hypothetical protein